MLVSISTPLIRFNKLSERTGKNNKFVGIQVINISRGDAHVKKMGMLRGKFEIIIPIYTVEQRGVARIFQSGR